MAEEAQSWHLALGAVQVVSIEGEHELLGGLPRPSRSAEAVRLLRDQAILRADDVAPALQRLLDGTAVAPAWNLAEAVALAGRAYAAYLIDAKAAWRWIRRAGDAARRGFGSWHDFAARCRASAGEEAAPAIDRLLADPDGPWSRIRWDLDPAIAELPPLPPQKTWIVVPGSGLPTIGSAIARARIGDRIIVCAGRYRERLEPRDALEIVAEGEVVLEAGDDEVAFSAWHDGFVLRGLTLRGGAAARAGDFLRLEGCDLSGSQGGVVLADHDAVVQLGGGRIHGCGGPSLIVHGGVAALDGVELAGGASHGLTIHDGAVTLRRCTLRDHAHAHVDVQGGEATIEDATIEGGGAGSIWVRGGRARLADTSLRGSPITSIEVDGDGQVEMRGGSITGCQAGAVVHARGALTLVGVAVTGTEAMGLDLKSGTSRVERCEITSCHDAGVEVRAAARATLIDTTVAGVAFYGDSGGIGVNVEGHATLERCTIRDVALRGLQVSGEGEVVASDCALDRAAEIAVFAADQSRLTLTGGRVEGAGETGLYLAGARAVVDGAVVAGNGGAAVFCGESVEAALRGCELTAAPAVALEAGEQASVRVADCRLRAAGGESALFVYDDARVELDGGELDGGEGALILVEGGGRATLRGARLRPGRGGLVKLDEGGAAPRLEACTEDD